MEGIMDWDSAEGKKLAERLRKEMVIWLTTVRPDGMPVPTPVWFVWEGESFLMYSQPGTHKLRNLAANPKASLNLNSDEWGDSIAVFTGEVTVEDNEPPAIQNPAYLEKYREGITNIQMTPETFTNDYSIALRFHIKNVRAW
jgi:PPOX class probable F420-dependent enzyme